MIDPRDIQVNVSCGSTPLSPPHTVPANCTCHCECPRPLAAAEGAFPFVAGGFTGGLIVLIFNWCRVRAVPEKIGSSPRRRGHGILDGAYAR